MSRIYLILFFLLLSFRLLSQTQTAYIKAGDKAFEKNDFFTAAYHYKQAIENDSNNLYLNYKYAEASRLSNNYQEAVFWYKRVYDMDQTKFPEVSFHLAGMLKTQRRYAEAGKLFEEYYEKNRQKESLLTKKALLEIKACQEALSTITDSLNIEIVNPGYPVNTSSSDFAAFKSDSILFFSSLRENTSASIYQKNPSQKNAVKLPDPINFPGSNNANACLSPDGNRLYFTRCKIDEKTGNSLCGIYLSTRKGKKWSEAKPVKSVNSESYTSTQPNISKLNEKQFILYYSSDKKGGQGGMDIWYAVFDNSGKVIEQGNAGKEINSPTDEITPFYHSASQTLYFSSNWHPGLGLFDIFKTQGSKNKWNVPVNAGYPLNTAVNDLYFSLNTPGEEGYLTSNRAAPSSTVGTCCNDIFVFRHLKKTALPQDSILTSVNDSAAKLRESINQAQSANYTAPEVAKEAVVYFHNDEPNPRSLATTTTLTYEECYESYLRVKPHYFKEFSAKDEEAIRDNLSNFFEMVEEQLDKLHELFSFVQIQLEQGREVTVSLSGFCSPLNNTQYNVYLAKRRISSVKNSMEKAGLMPYVKSGKLILTENVLGESKAAADVSDKLEDKKNSVYNPKAARERWVEIKVKDIK